jgi:glucans biosynthesis protein
MSHPSLAGTAAPAGPPPAIGPSPSPAGKRRGNPDLGLAPRCGARTRGGCPCRAPAIRDKLRCRMHGGRSTGPRTADMHQTAPPTRAVAQRPHRPPRLAARCRRRRKPMHQKAAPRRAAPSRRPGPTGRRGRRLKHLQRRWDRTLAACLHP